MHMGKSNSDPAMYPKSSLFHFLSSTRLFLIAAPCGCLQKQKKKNPGHIDLNYTPNSPCQSNQGRIQDFF